MKIEGKEAGVILEFLRSHPLISLNALEIQLRIPKTTLNKAIRGDRNLPVKYISRLKDELKKYGLKM